MKVVLTDGRLFIDGKEALTVIFKDGSTMSTPFEQNEGNGYFVESGATVTAIGKDNTAISGKNIVVGSNITVPKGGSFRLGDG